MFEITEDKWVAVFMAEEDCEPDDWPREEAEQANIRRLINQSEIAPLLETECLRLLVAFLEEIASMDQGIWENLVENITGKCTVLA